MLGAERTEPPPFFRCNKILKFPSKNDRFLETASCLATSAFGRVTAGSWPKCHVRFAPESIERPSCRRLGSLRRFPKPEVRSYAAAGSNSPIAGRRVLAAKPARAGSPSGCDHAQRMLRDGDAGRNLEPHRQMVGYMPSWLRTGLSGTEQRLHTRPADALYAMTAAATGTIDIADADCPLSGDARQPAAPPWI